MEFFSLGLSHTAVALISLTSFSAPIVAVFVSKLIDKGKARLLTKCGLVSLACASLVTPILGVHVAFFLIAIFYSIHVWLQQMLYHNNLY